MSTVKDVDDVILEHARSLLPYVCANGNPDTKVKSLSEVPWLLVMVFELLTTESIPQDMKPFSCFEEQAHTLQMILDTLEQTLRLPMNHITGKGLVRLERRHLSDALQIFSDLVKHCYPQREPQETGNTGVSGTPEGRTLSISQFESPEFGAISFIQSCTPELSAFHSGRGMHLQEKQLENNATAQKPFGQSSRNSPVMTVRPVPKTFLSALSSVVKEESDTRYAKVVDNSFNKERMKKNNASIAPLDKDDSLHSSKSSMTLLKEVYRKNTIENESSRDKIGLKPVKESQKNKISSPTRAVFEQHLPSLALLSPVKSNHDIKKAHYKYQPDGRSRNASPLETRTHRYSPYEHPSKQYDLIEYPMTKRVRDCPSQPGMSSAKASKDTMEPNHRSFKRRPSVNRVVCRKPSVKSFRSPKPSVPKRAGTLPKENAYTSINRKSNAVPNNKIRSVKEHNISSRASSYINTSTVSKTESRAPPSRAQKPSVAQSKPNPHVTSNVRKPPQPLTRKPSSKSVTCTNGQRPYSRAGTSQQRTSVSSRRQANVPAKENALPSGNEKHQTISTHRMESNSSPISYEHTSYNRRRPSVVSTKVRRHSSVSSRSPVHSFERNSRFRRPVKRGNVSPQTTSLCSSLKLLEEFDYIKRRLKEIKVQKREYMEAINELELEEVRLEYLFSHVRQQSDRALSKGPYERVASLGAAV